MAYAPAPRSHVGIGEGEEYELRAPDVYLYDPVHDAKIVDWRVRCFERLGFEPLHANALAIRRDVDRVDVERLVKAGCALTLVSLILL